MVISNWVSENYSYIKKKGVVLDLACGSGRHGRFLLEKGFNVVFLDQDTSKLDWVPEVFKSQVIKHDLENGTSWGFLPSSFDAVVVTNYLYRPIFPDLLSIIDEGGVLIYETFSKGNEIYGKPTNSNYLLEPEELIDLVRPSMRLISFKEGYSNDGKESITQKIVAVKRPAKIA
tara:strand:- start:610 stop:1131 length:522 start_codon:yes stop_codon:yes gene_type:complete